jgi:hypothetical protein
VRLVCPKNIGHSLAQLHHSERTHHPARGQERERTHTHTRTHTPTHTHTTHTHTHTTHTHTHARAHHSHKRAHKLLLQDASFGLRWMTPTIEVALCGHGTMAAAAALLSRRNASPEIVFHTLSGPLAVRCAADGSCCRNQASPNYFSVKAKCSLRSMVASL